MNIETIVGIFASTATGTALLPQLIKIIKEKKSESVSMGMLALLFAGLAGWICYGILKSDWIIIISNSFSLVINTAITVLSVKYKEKKT